MKKIRITNGRILTPSGITEGKDLLLSDGVIMGFPDPADPAADCLLVDAGGGYVSPGFVDIHVHGGGGADFMDGQADAFQQIAITHARFGTTSMVPTTMSGSPASIIRMLDVFRSIQGTDPPGADLLGVHLEGPYLAPTQVGAQDPRHLRHPDPAEYQPILEAYPELMRWSVAPELPGALAMGRQLKERGIVAAMAHTDAIYEEVLQAVGEGYSLSTHLYSGMSGVTRRKAFRYAGVIESSLLMDEIDVELIADGVHLPAPLLQLVYKVKGPSKIALITDAMRAAAEPEGPSMLGHLKEGIPVIVEDGVAKLPDRSSFAGSVATADRLVRTMMRLGKVPLPDAVRMASETPARIMGVLSRKGTIEAGKDADIVLFDEDIQIRLTIVKGKIVYSKP